METNTRVSLCVRSGSGPTDPQPEGRVRNATFTLNNQCSESELSSWAVLYVYKEADIEGWSLIDAQTIKPVQRPVKVL